VPLDGVLTDSRAKNGSGAAVAIFELNKKDVKKGRKEGGRTKEYLCLRWLREAKFGQQSRVRPKEVGGELRSFILGASFPRYCCLSDYEAFAIQWNYYYQPLMMGASDV
jgi:hypothetical protein